MWPKFGAQKVEAMRPKIGSSPLLRSRLSAPTPEPTAAGADEADARADDIDDQELQEQQDQQEQQGDKGSQDTGKGFGNGKGFDNGKGKGKMLMYPFIPMPLPIPSYQSSINNEGHNDERRTKAERGRKQTERVIKTRTEPSSSGTSATRKVAAAAARSSAAAVAAAAAAPRPRPSKRRIAEVAAPSETAADKQDNTLLFKCNEAETFVAKCEEDLTAAIESQRYYQGCASVANRAVSASHQKANEKRRDLAAAVKRLHTASENLRLHRLGASSH